jgi:hypothetical protein
MITVGLPDAITSRVAYQDSSPVEPESANERKYETDDVNTNGCLSHFSPGAVKVVDAVTGLLDPREASMPSTAFPSV